MLVGRRGYLGTLGPWANVRNPGQEAADSYAEAKGHQKLSRAGARSVLLLMMMIDR